MRTIRAWDLASDIGAAPAALSRRGVRVRHGLARRAILRGPRAGRPVDPPRRRERSDHPDDLGPTCPTPRRWRCRADGRSLAAAAAPNRVLVWDLRRRPAPRVFSDDELRPDRLVFSPDGSTLVAVAGGRQVSRARPGDGPEARDRVARSGAGRGRSTSRSRPTAAGSPCTAMASPAARCPTAIWQVATGHEEKVFPGRRTFQYMSFAPDGESLFLGGDHDVSIWRPQPTDEFDTFANHHDEVWAVAFSPDGATVASGGDDDTLRLWDPATGRERAVL